MLNGKTAFLAILFSAFTAYSVTITTLNPEDTVGTTRGVVNTNFSNLKTAVETGSGGSIDAYLFGGQSNMTGQPGAGSVWGPVIGGWTNQDESIHFSNWNGGTPTNTFMGGHQFGPELSASKLLSAGAGGEEILIVKLPTSANPMTNFIVGGVGYTAMTNHIAFATNYYTTNLNKSINFQRLFWLQGETDALVETNADTWASNFTNMVEGLESDLGLDNLPVTIGVISRPGATYESNVRSQQMTPDGFWSWFDTERYDRPADNLHLDVYSLIGVGKEFAFHDLGSTMGVLDENTDTFWVDGAVNIRSTAGSSILLSNAHQIITFDGTLAGNEKAFQINDDTGEIFYIDAEGDIETRVIWSRNDTDTYRQFFIPDSQIFVCGNVRFLDMTESTQDRFIINWPGLGDIDFEVTGLDNAGGLFMQGSDGFVRIGSTTNAPLFELDVEGDAHVEGNFLQSVEAGITASTTQTQGQQPLTLDINEVSTVSNANDVVTLPTARTGMEVFIINNGANTLQIFPASGDDLGAGVDTAATLASAGRRKYVAYDATNWVVE